MAGGWLLAAGGAGGAALLTAAGCVQAKGGDAARGGADVLLVEAWQPRAESLRIYPSTRFVQERDTPLLEARVELLDAMGDSIKGSGRARFELRAAGENPGLEEGRLLYSWDVAITTLEDQRDYYDPVTRAYLLRLRLTDAAITQRQVLLRVSLETVDGRRLTDAQPVRIDW